MKRASYRQAIEWIVMNDEGATDMTEQECGELVTACLVADLFGVCSDKVAHDIHRARQKEYKT